MSLSIAIVGNPNCGKTTLFNALTGARQRVGNWPGVTVDRKSGVYGVGADQVEVIDLPGVYTLGIVPGMDAVDEKVTRDFVLSRQADVVVNIVDASNLERNLYLTAQLLEMRVPMVVALNMMDVADEQGLAIDVVAMRDALGCPVVPLVAARQSGIDGLKEAVARAAGEARPPTANVAYQGAIESLIERLCPDLAAIAKAERIDVRWLAVKALELDDLARRIAAPALTDDFNASVAAAEAELGEDMDILIADGRYAFANGLAQDAVRRIGQASSSVSDAIDRWVLNPWLGTPIFLGIMYLMFMFTINVGGAFIDFFDIVAGTIFVDGVKALLGPLEAMGLPAWVGVLVADGAGGGIQVVATFIPIIGFLYLFLSALEDSGYMARAAFLMDRLMRVVGLPGKSFVPLIVGFGCNVPAIMASRTLDKERDRIMTTLMTPFMSCGARLAVYALFAAAFFPSGGQNVVFALYLIGIAAAIGTGLVLRHTLLMGETSPFLMELPPYHLPRPRDVLIHTWNRLKGFIFGAGQIIVVVVTVLSFFNSLGTDGSFGNEDSGKSVLSAVGRAIVPAFEPMGITDDNWPATVGIFTGVFAKEAVVGTLDSLYSNLAGEGAAVADEAYSLLGGLEKALATIPDNLAGLADLVADPLGIGAVEAPSLEQAAADQAVAMGTFGAMTSRFDGAAGAFAYMLFILLYFPCVAALGAVNRETGPRWALFAALWTTGLAYVSSVSFYQAARFTAHPGTSALWIAGLALALALVIWMMRRAGRGVGGSHLPTHAEPAP
jgi:ferrous iron transport protein B